MNIKRVLPLFLSLCLPITAFAIEVGDGLYVSAFGGIAGVPNNINKDGFNHVRYKAGFDAGGAFGYQSGPFRYEVDATYIRAAVKNFKLRGVDVDPASGHSDAMAVMANINYDFYIRQPVVAPFLGFGIGFARVSANINSDNSQEFRPDADYSIAFQGNAGLKANLTSNISVNVAYRYFTTTHVSDLGRRFQAHLGNIGLSYRFFDVPVPA